MGHDITAIKDYNEKFEGLNEIAYLRRSMHSETIHKLYEYLECSEIDAEVSGGGHNIFVKLETIKKAMTKIAVSGFDSRDKDDYLSFLIKIFTYCEDYKQEGVIINFN